MQEKQCLGLRTYLLASVLMSSVSESRTRGGYYSARCLVAVRIPFGARRSRAVEIRRLLKLLPVVVPERHETF